jgi:hypothetical protein
MLLISSFSFVFPACLLKLMRVLFPDSFQLLQAFENLQCVAYMRYSSVCFFSIHAKKEHVVRYVRMEAKKWKANSIHRGRQMAMLHFIAPTINASSPMMNHRSTVFLIFLAFSLE